MRCVGIATLACSQGGRDRAWCLISGLLQVTLVCTFPIQHRKGSTLSHWSSRGSCYPCTPGAGGQLLPSTLRSPRDGWAAVHTLLLQWGWSLVPVWSLEWAAAPNALQEWGGQWNFWCGDWEVILSIQVKTLSKQLNNPFWAPRGRTLSGNLQATTVWSYVGKFYLSGPQSPQLDREQQNIWSFWWRISQNTLQAQVRSHSPWLLWASHNCF